MEHKIGTKYDKLLDMPLLNYVSLLAKHHRWLQFEEIELHIFGSR